MEIDHVKVLETANWYHDLNRRGMKYDKPTALKELAQYSLFSARELGWIVGVSEASVDKQIGWRVPEYTNHRVWKLEALHVLWLLAVDWRDNEEVAPPLAQLASEHGTSMKAISQLTGIPLNQVREAVYGKPDLLDLLRAGADAPSD